MTSKKLLARTSLRGSAGGITRYSSQGGRQTQKSGPDLVPANPLATQAKGKALKTTATCGPSGLILSSPADQLSSLVSKLSARLGASGGTLYRLTWKVWDTPQGRSIYALRASARRTSGNDCSGWATPTTRDHKDGASDGTVPINALLGRQVWTTQEGKVVLRVNGAAPTGYIAETVNGDRLNPEHSRWLMGYPAEWASCAPTETRSSLKRRQS